MGYAGAAQSASLKKLKTDLKDALKASGVLHSVKAQIRREFISSLSESGKAGKVMQQSGAGEPSLRGPRRFDFKARLALSASYHLLRRHGLVHSLSVFAAESGLDDSSALLTERDIVAALNASGSSPLHRAVSDAMSKETRGRADKENRTPSSALVRPSSEPAAATGDSVLELLFEHCFSLSQHGGRDSSTQTDSPTHAESPRDALDHTVKALRAAHLARLEEEKHAPSRDATHRLLAYQRECDVRAARDVELQMDAYRSSTIAAIRLEEAQKARLELQALRNEMDAEHVKRSQQQAWRDAEAQRVAGVKEQQQQMAAFEARQKMQREMDEMRSRELAAGRKVGFSHSLLFLPYMAGDIPQPTLTLSPPTDGSREPGPAVAAAPPGRPAAASGGAGDGRGDPRGRLRKEAQQGDAAGGAAGPRRAAAGAPGPLGRPRGAGRGAAQGGRAAGRACGRGGGGGRAAEGQQGPSGEGAGARRGAA